MDGDVDAAQDVSVTSVEGNILLLGDIDAGLDVKVKTGGNGGIMLNNPLNPVYGEATGDVHAGRNVTLETENTGLLVAGTVTTDTGDVVAITKKGVIGFLGNVDAGRNVEASITEGDASSEIRYRGIIRAGNDVKATTPQGNIGYYNEVYADGSVTAKTGVGDVEYNGNVVAIDNVRADVLAGDITVGENVITRNGAITLTTADGAVEVGEDDGSGHIMAGGDVSIDTKKGGYVDVKTYIGSAHGSVSVKSGERYIHIGNNGPDTDTVKANKNVTLEVANGKITVDGKTSTEEGDITLKAANKEYVEGEAGKNIIINHTGKVESAGNANLIAVNGDLHVTDNVEAASTLNAETRGQGDISLDQNVTVVKDMIMQADKGDITVGKDITAEKGTVTIDAKSGSVAVGKIDGSGNKSGKIEAGGNVTIKATQPAAGDRNLVDVVTSVESKSADVSIKTVNGNIHIGSNDANTETVTAKNDVNLEAVEGKIIIDGKTSTLEGDITLKATNNEYEDGADNQNIIINQSGVVDSGGDANLITANGDLQVTDNVKAEGSVNAQTHGKGNISLGQNVNVENDITLETQDGNITVGKNITASQGSVTLTTGTGSITVGVDDGNGQKSGIIESNSNVNINAGIGNVNIETSVESKAADVNVSVADGNIHIGNNGPDVKTVTAKEDVTLETNKGKITVDGMTSTEEGDITLKAASENYTEGAAGQNIIINNDGITHNGVVKSGNDATLITKNSDLVVTNDVTAQGTFYAKTEGEGDITLGENLNVQKDLSMSTDNGDITVGQTVTATQGSVGMTTGTGEITIGEDVTAGNNVSVTTGTGNVTVGSNGKGSVTADKDVVVTVGKGDVDIVKSVASTESSVDISTQDGNIHIGNNGPDVKTVTAKEDVTLETEKGKITVDGKTSTEEGDITLKAASENYTEGAAGQNIIINNDGITHNGVVESGNDATLITKNSDLLVTDDVKAKGSLNTETQGKGNISLAKDVTVDNDITLQTDEGDIEVGKKVTSNNGSVDIKTGTGKITIGEDVTAGNNVSVTTGTGNVTVGSNVTGKGSVAAAQDVVVTVGKGDVNIVKSVASNSGDVAVTAGNGDIEVGADVSAGANVSLETTGTGNIEVGGEVTAKDSVTAETDSGYITVGEDVAALKEVKLTTGTGKVTVGDTDGGTVIAGEAVTIDVGKGDVEVSQTVKSTEGTVDIDVEEGNVTVGSNVTGKGSVTAAQDVVVTVGKGDVDIVKSVTSTESSVDISTQEGKIHIGNNGPTVKTVTAKENISLVTENGKIEVSGKTSTENGDITLKAANPQYIEGADGQNIIINHYGQIASGQDATLIAKNGDLHVTDKVTAQRDVNAITQSKGDVFLDSDLNIQGSVTMKTDIGDIFADQNVKAGNRIVAATGNGNITVGTADAKYVSLTSGGKDGHVTANTIRAQANGNKSGTAAEDIKLGGSHVNVNSVVNGSNGTVPLAISTLGGAADKPMKDFNIGTQVADGVYTGGIESTSGAVVQGLWTDRGLLYEKGDTNLHISKVVVNEKLHVANDKISVAVFGVPPYHDGARMVYWNDADAKNPSSQLSRWFDQSYSDPNWMYLDLYSTGDVGSRYGVLMDAHWYRNIYGDSVSMVDTMRVRTDFKPLESNIVYFDRVGLLDYQEVFKAGSAITDAQEDEIEIETEGK